VTAFARRRVTGIILVVLATILLTVLTAVFDAAFVSTRGVHGWLLAAMIVFLACYQIRKRLTMLPLGTSALWLQLHIYIGLSTLPVFFLHTDGRLPRGPIEIFMLACYLIVFLSGAGGLLLSRIIPPRLRNRGGEALYERIPGYVRRIAAQTEKLISTTAEESVIRDLFEARLRPYFEQPANFWRHVMHSQKHCVLLLDAVRDAGRFAAEEEQLLLNELTELVQQKDDLDYQYAMQSILKYWLFIHVPLTWALIVMTIFHASVALMYS